MLRTNICCYLKCSYNWSNKSISELYGLKKKSVLKRTWTFFFSYQVDIPRTEASFWEDLQELAASQSLSLCRAGWWWWCTEYSFRCLSQGYGALREFSVVSAIWAWVAPLQENSKPHLVDIQGSYHHSSVPQLAKISISSFAVPWRTVNAYPLFLWDFSLSTPHCLGS